MEKMLLFGVFVFLLTALFAIGTAILQPQADMRQRMQWLLGRSAKSGSSPEVKGRFFEVLEPLANAIPKSPANVSRTRALLIHAGYRDERYVRIYSATRVLAVLAAGLIVLVSRSALRAPLTSAALVGLAYFLPLFVLKHLIRKRQAAIQQALPDALDLCVICVEAGLGLDESLSRVGAEIRHAHPELSGELELVDLELRAGKPRAEALRNLASRTGVDDIRMFVGMLIQTDRYGTSIAGALRVYSESFRTGLSQQVQERAAKTTVKIVPVLVICIFPAMLVAMFGPAAIALIRLFSVMGGK
jgi:tight adherence protein C